jgi:hypothetical protein
MLKEIVPRDFLPPVFHQTPPPGPNKHAQERLRCFKNIRRVVRLFRCFTGVNDTGEVEFYCSWLILSNIKCTLVRSNIYWWLVFIYIYIPIVSHCSVSDRFNI